MVKLSPPSRYFQTQLPLILSFAWQEVKPKDPVGPGDKLSWLISDYFYQISRGARVKMEYGDGLLSESAEWCVPVLSRLCLM